MKLSLSNFAARLVISRIGRVNPVHLRTIKTLLEGFDRQTLRWERRKRRAKDATPDMFAEAQS